MTWFLLAFTSALLSATAAISQKKILFKLDALEFSFALAIFNMFFSLPFFIVVDFGSLTFTSLAILYGKTIMGALAFLCVMLAIKNMEISGALPLMVLTPGLVAFFAFVLLGESLTNYEIIGMVILLVGTYILESKAGFKFWWPAQVFIKSKFHHYVIFALLLFTATSLLDKLLLRDFQLPPFTFMAFQQIFLAFNFLIIAIFTSKKPRQILQTIEKENWLWIIIVAVLTIGYRYTQIEAVKIAPVALVLAVKRTSVFFAAVGGGNIFKEHDLLKKTIATVIMVIGAMMILQD